MAMTSTTSKEPTHGQIERTLSQQFQKLYRQHLNHPTGKVSCQLSKDKLIVTVEDSLTQPEQVLLEGDNPELVEQVRTDLDSAIRPKIVNIVEETLGRKVLDLMSGTTLETGRTGIIVVLSEEDIK